MKRERLGFRIKLLAGPLAFWLICNLPVQDLSWGARLTLATLGWQVIWWISQPIPWAITSLLPLVLFPLTSTLSIKATAAYFGQVLFFWIMGLTLFGYAIQKHGLAKRFALFFMTLPGVASSTGKLFFSFMAATFCISSILSDASAVAMMLPLGLALQSYLDSLSGRGESTQPEGGPTVLASFFVLASLYGAVAGGVTTLVGMPHSPVALAQLEILTQRTIGWFQWMMVGVPVGVTLLVCFYLLLRFFFRSQIRAIPGGREFLLTERRQLGPMKGGEKKVLLVFVLAAALFTLPALLPSLFGNRDPLVNWMDESISIWVVSPIIMLLLFSIPVDLSQNEFLLNWKEAAGKVPWHVILLVTSATGLIDMLSDFGFMELVSRSMEGLSIDRLLFPFIVSFTMAFSTNFVPGVPASALFTAILVPIAQQIGFNPASITVVVPTSALGLLFPWAGSTTATAFGFGKIALKDMIKVGIFAELILVLVIGAWSLVFESIL